MTVTNGILSACGAASCVVVSDANGLAASGVTPGSAGAVTLTASLGSAMVGASFNAMAKPDVLMLASPLAASARVGDAVPVLVRALLADGVSSAANKSVDVTVTGGNAVFAGCGGATCLFASDSQGYIHASITASAAGTISMSFAEPAGGSNALNLSFVATAKPDTMTLVSAPSGNVPVGQPSAMAFAVRVLEGDGVTPAAGRSVVFSVSAGQASFAVCGGATCTLVTDASGTASSTVTAAAAGGVTIQASEAGNVVSASFNAVPRPDVLEMVSTPGASVRVDATAVAAFAVRLVLADGTTPVASSIVTFSVAGQGSGAVAFGSCHAALCAVATDASGLASVMVTGVAAGALTLVATADPATGAGTVSWGFQVVANDDSLNAIEAVTYVAEGAVFQTKLDASALSNGAAAVGQAVVWSGAAGIALVQVQGTTGADGVATAEVAIGPLGAGTTATATACAWTNICASFAATGVGLARVQIAIVTGGQQAMSGGLALMPVVAQVTDAAGHAVAGAGVTIDQTVSALTVDCVGKGRCASQPVIGSKVTVATSDGNGMVSVAPLSVAGEATSTELAFSVGSAGFATAVVTSRP